MNYFSLNSLSYSCPCRSQSAIPPLTPIAPYYLSALVLVSLAFHYLEELGSFCKSGNFTIHSFFQMIDNMLSKCGSSAVYLQATNIVCMIQRNAFIVPRLFLFFLKPQDQRIPPSQKNTLTFSNVFCKSKNTTFYYSPLLLFSITLPKAFTGYEYFP